MSEKTQFIKNVLTNGEPVRNKKASHYKTSLSSTLPRIQRLSISEDARGNAVMSIILENVSPKEALQALIDVF
jgi:hypothetical protein